LERAEAFPTSQLHRPDFGDGRLVRRRPGRFQIDDDERDLVEWRPQVIERPLPPSVR